SIVEDGFALCQGWQPDAFVVETNGFQSLVADAFLRVAAERRFHLPLYGVCSTTPKPTRIRRLGAYLAQHRLRIKNTLGGRLLLKEGGVWREVEGDDGPGACAWGVGMLEYLLGHREGPENPGLVRG